MFKKIVMLLATALLFIPNISWAAEEEVEKLSVMTSFYPMYEFTRKVGGDRIDVDLMVSGNASPHGYEPSAQDIIAMNQADVFVYSSDQMEYWVSALLNNVDNDDLVVVRAFDQQAAGHDHDEEHYHEETVSETDNVTVNGLSDHYHTGDVVTLEVSSDEEMSVWEWQVRHGGQDWETVEGQADGLFEYEAGGSDFDIQVRGLNDAGEVIAESGVRTAHIDNHDELDPHSWLDPVLAQEQVNTIRDALIQADPEGEAEYTANAESFNQELQTLDADYQTAFEGAENRSFVVQHEAFGYLAERYDLEQISVGGLSTEVEPSPARIGEITQIINELGASYIYYQQGSNTAIADTIALETGTEILELYDLEQAPEDQEMDYLAAMRHNLDALQMSIQ